METYYTKKEYNDMKSQYERRLKAKDKKIASLEKKIADLEDAAITYQDTITELQVENVKLSSVNPVDEDVAEESDSNE